MACRILESVVVGTRAFQQFRGAHHVGGDEGTWVVDGTIHVGFGCKIYNPGGLMVPKKSLDESSVGDITPQEVVAGFSDQLIQTAEVAGIGEFVDDNHAGIGLGQCPANEVATDEPGASGNHHRFHQIILPGNRVTGQSRLRCRLGMTRSLAVSAARHQDRWRPGRTSLSSAFSLVITGANRLGLSLGNTRVQPKATARCNIMTCDSTPIGQKG